MQEHIRLKILNTLALPALLLGCETLAIREQRMTYVETKFMNRMAKYTWQGYKTNEDILSELKTNPVVKKIKNYINEWV